LERETKLKNYAKKLMAFVVYYLRILDFCFWVHHLLTDRHILAVFAYHRITKKESVRHFSLPYDKGLDEKTFAHQIKTICQYFDNIGLDEFVDFVTGEKKLERSSALITFDDADSEFIENAYPLLKKSNCKMVIFVPTGFSDTSKRFWHLRLSNILYNLTDESLTEIKNTAGVLPESILQIILSYIPSDTQRRDEFCQELVDALDKLDYKIIDNMIQIMEKYIGSEYKLDIKCMGWEELRYLSQNGADIESHTVTHRRLSQLTPLEIEKELVESKARIEYEINKPVQAICYPAGNHSNVIHKAAKQAGYKLGFIARSRLCRFPLKDYELFHIPRLSLYGNDIFTTHCILCKELLKNIFEIVGRALHRVQIKIWK